MGLTPAGALLGAAALHLGFQAVVTTVVYPALAEVPPERWGVAHAAHSHRIARVVGPVYGVLAAACVRVLVTGRTGPTGPPGPPGRPSPLTRVALAGAAGAALAAVLAEDDAAGHR